MINILRLAPLLLLLLFPGCEGKIKPSVSSIGLGFDVPTQESWNASITFTDSGRINAVLHAGHIAIFSDRKYTKLDSGVAVDFYDENGRRTSVLTAKRGLVNDITHDFEVHDNVVVVSDSGTTLATTELHWTNATERVHTPAYVEINTRNERLYGHGLESDKSLTHYTIYKPTGKAKTNEPR